MLAGGLGVYIEHMICSATVELRLGLVTSLVLIALVSEAL